MVGLSIRRRVTCRWRQYVSQGHSPTTTTPLRVPSTLPLPQIQNAAVFPTSWFSYFDSLVILHHHLDNKHDIICKTAQNWSTVIRYCQWNTIHTVYSIICRHAVEGVRRTSTPSPTPLESSPSPIPISMYILLSCKNGRVHHQLHYIPVTGESRPYPLQM